MTGGDGAADRSLGKNRNRAVAGNRLDVAKGSSRPRLESIKSKEVGQDGHADGAADAHCDQRKRTARPRQFVRAEKDGYRLYPLDVPLEVRRTLQSEASGIAVVKKLEWEDNRTTVTYELVSLYSTN